MTARDGRKALWALGLRPRQLGAICSLLLLGAASTLAACSETTQVVVEIDAADDVKADAAFVRIQVEGSASGADFTGEFIFDSTQPVADSWPLQHVLAPFEGDASRQYRVTVRALDDEFDPVSEVRGISGFVDGTSRAFHLFLPGGECLGVTCTSETTCDAQGLCVDVPVTDPGELPPLGTPAPTDAGITDAATDAAPMCVAGEPCTPEGEIGVCEVGMTERDEGTEVCVVQLKDAEAQCRPAVDGCDVAETCNGTSPECPADEFAAIDVSCGDDLFCIGGACSACTAGESCDTGNPCQLGVINCDSGAPVCMDVGVADEGTVCRPSAGLCDAEELCDGPTCPGDSLLAAGASCRVAAGDCDAPELCDGASAACPDDVALAVDTICREGTGLCDPPERCDGSSVCPAAGGLSPEGTPCRAAATECDAAELCDGTDDDCPPDGFLPYPTTCTDGVCISGTCGTDPGCGSSCGGVCENATIDCTDGMSECVNDSYLGSTVECRASAGDCDTAEFCTGSTPDCPTGVLAPATTECRGVAVGVLCGRAEYCTGAHPTCPGDGHLPTGTVCRPAASGAPCDVPERCSGTSNACPVNAFATSGVCRAPTGLCELPAVCDGSGPACPENRPRSSGAICRPVAGACDLAEECNGTSSACPDDAFQPETFVCRDVPATAVCDVPELCTGREASCPPNASAMEGATCPAGVCTASGACDGVVKIGEVFPAGAASFVDLYNASGNDVSLAGCHLAVVNGAMNQSFPVGGTMAAHGFFLVAWSGVASMHRDVSLPTTATTLSRLAGTVSLVCGTSLVDLVGWASSPPALHSPPPIGRSLERKACSTSTGASMTVTPDLLNGNGHDTGSSAADWIVRAVPQPQSSTRGAEVPACE